MRARSSLVVIAAVAAFTATAPVAVTVHAGSPNPIAVGDGGTASYTGTVQPIEPDPVGPPAAVCDGTGAGGCDHETVNLTGAAANVLNFSVHYMPSDMLAQNCLDIAILNSAGTALAHQACVVSDKAITDPNAAPGAYTLEVDADGTTLPESAQSFTGNVSAATATIASPPSPTPVSAKPFTFTHQVSVDVQRGDGEPDLAISGDNKSLYTGTPYGFSTTVSLLYKSADGGVQWNNLHGSSVGDVPPCPNPVAAVLRPDCSRGGGDAEIQLSQPTAPSTQPTVQFEDLNGLDSISCAYSTNGGDTFNDLPAFLISGNPVPGTACNEGGTVPATCQTFPPPSTTCGTLGTDRQWQQVWPKADQPAGATSDILYMTFDTGDQPPSGDAAIFSPDNGQHWVAACTTTTGPSCLGGANGAGARPGPLVINPTLLNTVSAAQAATLGITAGTYPTLYEFMGTNSNGTEVNISCDGAQTWSHVATSNGQAGSTTNDFVVGTMDSNGELYTAYTVSNDPNPWRVWFAHSTDTAGTSKIGDCSVPVHGGAWSTPVPLTGPPSSADGVAGTPIPSEGYAVMPWITAGSGGRVDLVYYGSSDAAGQSPDTSALSWYMHMAQTLDGGTTWTDEAATETPMHVKSICFSGIGCTAQTPPGGDRNLLDFFQVKLDSSGRAVIIYTDDNNTAACAASCSPGIGLISEVQQATGPSLLASAGGGSGDVPALTNGLQLQSLNGDIRQADFNAEVTDPIGDAVVASAGHNIQGNPVPALDITDLKVCTVTSGTCPVTNTNASDLAFLFTVHDLSGGLASAVTGAHTGAAWLVTWRWNNDLWFAQASTDASGSALSCQAGRPLSVYNDGEPKAAEYTTVGNSEATAITGAGCTDSTTANTIEVDVPISAIGNVGASGDTTNHELYGLTGWTGESDATLPATTCATLSSNPAADTVDTCTGALGFFDNADETAPLDVLTSFPNVTTPESPAVPLLLALGAVVAGSVVYTRRRRRRPLMDLGQS